MTEALTAATETVIDEVTAIADPVERYFAARKVRAVLLQRDAQLKDLQQAIAQELKEDHTWAEVGELLGVSGSRAEALARGR